MSDQLSMFRFGLAVMHMSGKSYDDLMKLSLSDITILIDQNFDVTIQKGMDLSELSQVIEDMESGKTSSSLLP